MLVRLNVDMSGTVNGRRWPRRGGTVEVPDRQGVKLCAAGMAEPVLDDHVETAVPPTPEQRGPLTTSAFQPDRSSEPSDDEAHPRHVGAGWYELSNGERVRGKDTADAEQARLDIDES